MDLLLLPRFIRRLPDYYLVTRRLYTWERLKLPVNVCFFEGDSYFFTPDNLLVHNLWTHKVTSYYTRDEVRDWLTFSRGCHALLDAGASAGFFSAVFNRTAAETAKIVSVEPDPGSFALLRETMALNQGPIEWRAVPCALSNTSGEQEFFSTGFGGDLGGAGSTPERMFRGNDKPAIPATTKVRVVPLARLCRENGFTPDLIKMDIESFEHEALLGSLEFLDSCRPKLFLELHNEKIRGRGLDPRDLLGALFKLGYHCAGDSSAEKLCAPGIVHLALSPRR